MIPLTSPVILNSQELQQTLTSEDIVLVDTRSADAYAVGHLPGAINIPSIFSYLSTEQNGGLEGFVQYFCQTLGRSGITKRHNVVLYEDTLDSGYGQSCRGFFILDYLGHSRKAVLQGGFQDWQRLGFPISQEATVLAEQTYHPNVNKSIIVTMAQMQAALSNDSIIKLDCRDEDEWTGKAASPYGPDFVLPKGRIPGAVWLEWTKLMASDQNLPTFKNKKEILTLCESVGISEESTVYVYCFKGSRSSNTMLALKQAGIANVHNYFGSWNEWARQDNLPKDQRVLELHP